MRMQNYLDFYLQMNVFGGNLVFFVWNYEGKLSKNGEFWLSTSNYETFVKSMTWKIFFLYKSSLKYLI